ncbi:MAG: hypothetical protein HKN16_09990 [Saprospiraceae bacterium]|nr:hypothetical protein [Saprospiraceae bacterium]
MEKNMQTQFLETVSLIGQESQIISEERKITLDQLAQSIKDSMANFGFAKVISVCTHNSRRSQLMQIVLQFLADQKGISGIETFSGGTEGTAFNYRMVDALRHFGFDLRVDKPGENPVYQLYETEDSAREDYYFSKRFDNSYNPQEQFIAVMVCDEADVACPFVPGAFNRISLPYIDPKVSDDTPEEAQTYQDKVVEIAREMRYVVERL